ncbi:MAG: acetoin dehydrogenase, partial [Mycobacterium sp.]
AAEGLDKDKLAKTFDKRLASTSPQKAARIILDGVRKNKARVLVGNDAVALDLLARATGSAYQRLVVAVTSRTMPH